MRQRTQYKAPTSVKLRNDQHAEITWAARVLGTSRSRLMRHAALELARELREGAARPQRLHA
jgi:uncharacterized protein (DUF1778 family)